MGRIQASGLPPQENPTMLSPQSRPANLQFRAPPVRWSRILQFAIVFLAPQLSRADVRVEAYRGEPFGIGRVTIDLTPGASSAPASDDRFAVTEEKDRVLYPVIENKASRRILRGLL